MVRPCSLQRYSPPHRFIGLGFSLFGPAEQSVLLNWPHYRSDRFPCSIPAPEPGSRPLHAGHHLGSNQVTPRFHPEDAYSPRFRCHQSISTLHRGFAFARLPDPYLTGSESCLFPQRSAPRLFTDAPCGGLQPPPVRRLRRTYLHH